MAAIAGILVLIGLIVSLVGFIWVVVVAFKTSVLWGIGSLIIPFVALIFAIMHWNIAKKPFFIWLGGLVLMIIGAMMGGSAPGLS